VDLTVRARVRAPSATSASPHPSGGCVTATNTICVAADALDVIVPWWGGTYVVDRLNTVGNCAG